MRKFIVEKNFDYKGFKCVAVIHSTGYRCGYVGVTKDHRLYGKDYDDYLNINKSDIQDREVSGVIPLITAVLDDDTRVKIESYFQCHGGITYSGGGDGSNYPIESDLWWFGFDCAHAGDKYDLETAKILFADDPKVIERILYSEEVEKRYPIAEDEIRTMEYVADECKKLAEQLADFNEA